MKLLAVSFPCSEPIRQEFYASFQAQSGWDVRIVLPSRWLSEHGERRPQRWPAFQGKLIPLPVVLNGHIPLHFYRARLRPVLELERPDVIYVHHEAYGAATFQVYLANQRSVRAPIGFYTAQNLLKHYPWPFSATERYVYEHSAFALPVTQHAADVIKEKGYRGPAEVLPLPVDTNVYSPGRPAGGGARPPGAKLVVGCFGRLAAAKGVDTLLAALSRPEAAGISAVIGGDGPDAGLLKTRAAELGLNGRVRWAGYVPHHEAPDFYRGIDVLVVPSRESQVVKEQFGRVVPEALACGVPVVTSDSGELPRLVATTGAGWVFRQGDDAALAEILANLRGRTEMLRELGDKGRAAVEREFSLEGVAARFAAVVESSLERVHAG